MQFTGNIVALVTPFRNGAVDEDALAACIERAIAGGVSAVAPCGTTGESPTLTHEEHDAVVALTVRVAGGRVPVLAGTGSNSTAEAVRLSRAAAQAGASGLLSVTPYYNKPSQEGLRRHFEAVADATDLPVCLYDIPGRCGVALAPETVVALARHPNVAAIKEATGQVENVTRLRAETDLAVLSGDDALTLPILALGGRGVISVVSNVLPAAMTRLVRAMLDADLRAARAEHDRLYPLMKAMFLDTNPVPVKEAMGMLGWIEPELRLPLCRMDATRRERLAEILDRYRGEIG